ncbi:MAG: hypothetical protein JNK15_04080 [Planctomycetes bacterium]|nr:hypothetical protein [Planctomycetota bacterium]
MPTCRWGLPVLAIAVVAGAARAQKEPAPVVRVGDAASTERRIAAQHISRAIAVPVVDADAANPFAFTDDDRVAVDHFRAAASTAVGFDMVAAVAATGSPFFTRRALAALLEVNPVGHPERVVPPLLSLVDHADEVVVSMALPVLAKCTKGPMPAVTRKLLVDRAVAIWPKDVLTLHWIEPLTVPPYRQGWSPMAHFAREPRLIAIAVGTGDRGLIDRLVPPPGPAAPDAKDPRYGAYSWFVRSCLARAAPHVDDDTSRVLCGWFLASACEATPGKADQAWLDLSLEVLFGVFRHAPADLHANYRELLANDHVNQFFRRRIEQDPVDLVRLRLLLLPVERECDRDLVLSVPDYIVAAIAGTDAQRQRLVDILTWRVGSAPGVTRVGRGLQTVETWRASIDALAKLPAAQRTQVLEVIAAQDGLLALGIDVVPLLRAAQKERAEADATRR